MVMKKFILALTAAAMIATPAMAEQRRERSNNNDDVIAALIIGGLIGAAIADKKDREHTREYRRDRDNVYYNYNDPGVVYQPERYNYRPYQYYDCRDHMEVIYRNGRRVTYNVRSCN